MTSTSSPSHTTSRVDSLVTNAQERSAQGRATADDWRAIAALDEERARRELATFLRRSRPVIDADSNPYDRRPRGVGAVAGFVGGGIVVALIWQFLVPYLQDAWAGIDYGPGMATAITYVAPILLPLGAWLGVRWDRKRAPEPAKQPETTPVSSDASFNELLQRFCHTQQRGRARIY